MARSLRWDNSGPRTMTSNWLVVLNADDGSRCIAKSRSGETKFSEGDFGTEGYTVKTLSMLEGVAAACVVCLCSMFTE